MPPKRRRLGASVANPINLTGFTPLVSLLGDAQSFPTGALIDSQYRSRRAKKWWRVAIDAVRMMVRNLDPRIWVLNWSRGIRAPQIEIGNPGFDQWKANSRWPNHIVFDDHQLPWLPSGQPILYHKLLFLPD